MLYDIAKRRSCLPGPLLGFQPKVIGNVDGHFHPETYHIILISPNDRGRSKPLTNALLPATTKETQKATQHSLSLLVDESILDYVQRIRSHHSRSERVKELLRRAIAEEQAEALTKEAGKFYASYPRKDRSESEAFAAASTHSLVRQALRKPDEIWFP